MKRTTWLIPLLLALYCGSCQTRWGYYGSLESTMSDARASVCGFCVAMILLLAIRQGLAWNKGELTK